MHLFLVLFLLVIQADLYAITQAEDVALFEWNKFWIAWLIAPAGAAAALVFAYIFYKQMKAADPGNQTMVRIASYVRRGAFAYLKQQYKVVAIVFVILVGVLSIMAFVFNVQYKWVPFAFLTGGFFSGLAGFLGMNTATLASSRTAQSASQSLNRGLRVALRSGGVMGLVVVGLALIDITAWFYVLNNILKLSLQEVTVSMLAFGMGASTQALFARVGGGIYTKAADVGSDLVGKVEAGIPEDDPRNPATIADNVGDNVGDVAGMGADLYESYAGSVLATAAIGFATAKSLNPDCTATDALPWVMLPMVIAGVGNILSIVGIYVVRSKEEVSLKALMSALFRGINFSTISILVFALLAAIFLMSDSTLIQRYGTLLGVNKYILGVWGAIGVGLVAGWVIGKSTEYYTSNDFGPTRHLANQANTGPATVIIHGVAVGMLSTGIPVVTVGIGIFLAFTLAGGFVDTIQGLYGISIAAVGMLSTLGITLATDAYGPIADNAGGNAQMSNLPGHVRERTDALDALGNTTAATGKGFAIGSAALTALALLAAYIEEIRGNLLHVQGLKYLEIPGKSAIETAKATIADFMARYEVTLMNPRVLVGIFIGSMMVFLFCALTMKAVGRAAGRMVMEVRRQFKEILGIMEGKAEPDYASCVSIATRGAQKEMILPAFIAITVPILVGIFLDIGGVMGLLAGAMSTGFATAIMMASAGGSWDNAKKLIEKGHLGGKGSSAHKAAVIGDTVGDPFKDTSGPSLNILIKLMSMVSIVFVGVVLKLAPEVAKLWK
jgi:K(+)-stimulated pyrophosphate-energized sodium pump